MGKPKKISAGYIRVSTRTQVEEGTSLDGQRDKIKQYCNGFKLKLKKIYKDEGLSGSNIKDRPGINQVIAAIKKKEIDCFVYTKLDRLARNLVETEEFYQLSEKHGVEIICIDDAIFNLTHDASGKLGNATLMRQIMGSFAQFERSLIRERMQDGKDRAIRENKSTFGQIPLGYKKDTDSHGKVLSGKMLVDEKQADVVEMIYSLYIDEHYSLLEIANKLNADGIKTPSALKGYKRAGKKWRMDAVSNILKSSAYKGSRTYNIHEFEYRNGNYLRTKTEKPKSAQYTKEFPTIIKPARWKAVQRRIEFNRRKSKRTAKGTEDRFLCKSLIHCGECGSPMACITKHSKTGGKPFVYYACHRKSHSATVLALQGYDRCTMKYVPSDAVDDAVWSKVASCLADPVKFADNWYTNADMEALKSRRDNLRSQVDLKEKLISRMMKQWVGGGASATAMKALEPLLDTEEIELESLKNDLNDALQDYNLNRNNIAQLDGYKADFKKRVQQGKKKSLWADEDNIIEFLMGMPYKEKKRLLSAVTGPENGGKIIIRYPRREDILSGSVDLDGSYWIDKSDPALKSSMNVDEGKPIVSAYPMLEMRYRLDIGRIIPIINGLDKRDLLSRVRGWRSEMETSAHPR